MSTPQPPTRGESPADPNRPWLHQTNRPSTPPTQPSTPLPSVPQQQQPLHSNNPPQPTLTDAVQTIKPTDFLTFHQAPCARTGLLTGLGAGGAIGAVRWIMGLPVPRAANWAVGTGVLAAAAQYEYCQLKRRQEREKVKRVVEVYAAKQARERREEEERVRREREEAERVKTEGERGWWRFW
ncbi:hypothetical protein C8A05DRAFT_17136 [Staphylotrichum tortipilum]|uniref:Cytochrome c oxidase assembly protein COX20, mitochondrial n=1 Tax=Staphylotrichum tortipilum TaxID=2831512 RepID=A0AAN6RRC1_9PEZI|nr:hypothetical protein C8A05DRAFT_17136 [Staphylotrichum longicolle]